MQGGCRGRAAAGLDRPGEDPDGAGSGLRGNWGGMRPCFGGKCAGGGWLVVEAALTRRADGPGQACRPAGPTCPRDAAAMGVRSKLSKMLSMGLPSSASMTLTALSPENPGTLSWSCFSSSMYSLGRMSILVLRSCPSLMKVGPSSSSPCFRSAAITLRVELFIALSSTFRSFSSRRTILMQKE